MPRRQVKLSLNDSEYKDLLKMAKDAKMPLSTFVKDVVFTMGVGTQLVQEMTQVHSGINKFENDFMPVHKQDWSARGGLSSSVQTAADDSVILLSDVLLDSNSSSDSATRNLDNSVPVLRISDSQVGSSIASDLASADSQAGLSNAEVINEDNREVSSAGSNAKLNFNLSAKRKVEININM